MRLRTLINLVILYLLSCYGLDGTELVKQDNICREKFSNLSKAIAKSCQLELALLNN